MKSSFELRNFQIGSRDFEVRLQPTAQLKSSTFTLETHSTQLTLPLKHLNFISWTPSLPMLRKRRLMIAHSTKDSSTKYIIYNFQRLLCLLSYLRSLICFSSVIYSNYILIVIFMIELEEEAAGLRRSQENALCRRRAISVFYLRYFR